MDFSYTEEQRAVADLAKAIFKDRVTPERLKVVEAGEDRFDADLWRDLAKAGLLGTAIPEDHGGSGHDFLALCALLEQAGRAVAPIPLWPTLVLGALPLAEHGTDAQRRQWLPKIASGEAIFTAALLDESTRRVTAARTGSTWTLSGETLPIPAAHLATRILIPAATGENGELAIFLLDPKAKGVTTERQITTTGDPLTTLILDAVELSPDDILGAAPATGRASLDSLQDHATAALCALELGICERALHMTAKYTSTREQFDRPIATFQAVAQRAADAYVDLECIRLTTWQAAWLLSQRRPATDALAQAKFWAAEAGHHIVYAAQHLHGGIGFDLDYPLHRYYLAHKQAELTLGSASVHLASLGAHLATR
jgi:3-oxocholest-4-en-26-oyl-CoA dehydrogenase beta subunit